MSLTTEAAVVQAISTVSPLPFLAVDRSGAVTAWNLHAEELLGGCAQHTLGRPIADCGLRELLERALGGSVVQGEIAVWQRDEAELELVVSAAPLYVEGAVAGALAFALPVVEAPAHVENVLEGTRIAHELNNVMTAISGYSQLLLTHAEDEQRVRRDGERIADAAERATAIARQLGALVRRATARTPL